MKKRMLIAGMAAAVMITMAGCGKGQENNAGAQQEITGQTMEADAPKTETAKAEEPKVTADPAQETSREDDKEEKDDPAEKKDASFSGITEEEAKAAALKDAGVEESQVSDIRIHQEYDDGRQKYEVDFYVQNREYDYDIDAATGEILSADTEIEDDFFEWKEEKQEQQTAGETISREEALKIVLERVKGATEQNVELELEEDDGHWKYEGEIHYNQREYEFELNGTTGEVLEWSEEGMDD